MGRGEREDGSEASLAVMRHFSPWRAPPDNFIFMLYFLSYPDPPDYDNDEEGGHCDEGDGVKYFKDGHGQCLTNLFEITKLDIQEFGQIAGTC